MPDRPDLDDIAAARATRRKHVVGTPPPVEPTPPEPYAGLLARHADGSQVAIPHPPAAGEVLTSSPSGADPEWLPLGDRAPSLLGKLTIPVFGTGTAQQDARNAFVIAGRAYLTHAHGALVIADVADPHNPRVLSTVAVGAPTAAPETYRAVKHGRYVYIGCESNKTVDVVDVFNDKAPVVVAQITTGRWVKWLHASGRWLFVGEADNGVGQVQIFDLSNPLAVGAAVATVAVGDHPYGVWVEGRYAHVVSYIDDAYRIIDFSVPSAPVVVANVTTGLNTNPYTIAVEGARSYVVHQDAAGDGQGLQVWDISDRTAPVLMGHAAVTVPERSLSVNGGRVFTVDNWTSTLRVYDARNPAAITLQAEVALDPAQLPFWVEVVGNTGYITATPASGDGQGELQIWDLGGLSVRSLEAGALEAGTIASRGNARTGGDHGVGGALAVGSGAKVDGDSSVTGRLDVQRVDGANGSTALNVAQTAGNTPATVATLTGVSAFLSDSSTVAGSKARTAMQAFTFKTGSGASSSTWTAALGQLFVNAGSVAAAYMLDSFVNIAVGATATTVVGLAARGGNAGTITDAFGVQVEDLSGAGTITGKHRGVHIKPLTKGAAGQIHAIYVEGSTRSFFGGPVEVDNSVEYKERGSAPAAVADKAIVFARDNGAGKTQLCVQMPTGAPIVIATEA